MDAIGALQEQVQGARQQKNDKICEIHKFETFLHINKKKNLRKLVREKGKNRLCHYFHSKTSECGSYDSVYELLL